METARSIAALLSRQWVVLILALSFRKPLRKLLDRVVGFRLGGEHGVQATLATTLDERAGNVVEPETTGQSVNRRDAKLIVVRDDTGKERAKLGVTDTNSTALTLYDPAGKERISLFVLPDGSSAIGLFDEQRMRTFLARSDATGVEGVTVLGPDRRNGAFLLVGSEGYPSFDMTDSLGTRVFSAE